MRRGQETRGADPRTVKFLVIVNCGPCEAYVETCLNSILAQSHTNWTASVTVDPCGDATYERACAVARTDARIRVHGNTWQRFAMENLVRGIGRGLAAPDDVILVLDGDDWLHDPGALAAVAATYTETGCWMTYGSWISNLPSMPGLWPAYPEGTRNFRQVRWLATAVRSWKKWLWDRVDDAGFRDADGRYFKVGEDLAAMLPMLEMSGTARARHIARPLMVYNCANPEGAAKVWPEETRRIARLIRARPPYDALDTAPVSG